jgi:photosystem II stability/assembly factor-like uncharacterized protein
MFIRPLTLLYYASLTCFFACSTEPNAVVWQKKTVPTTDFLQKIVFSDANNGFIVGGKTWERGICLHTQDGGKTWQKDSLQGNSLYGLCADTEGGTWATGLIGQVFRRKKQDSTFTIVLPTTWHWFRDVAVRQPHAGFVAVGGAAWEHGKILRVFSDGSRQLDTFRQSLYGVTFSDSNTLHAVGYGIILRSTDGGKKWTISDAKGDFFQSVSFPDTQTGYAVGQKGTILKTTDAGKTWQSLRNGNAITAANAPFRAVFFADILRGCIVGDEGLLWFTRDGGATWLPQTGLPEADYYDVVIVEKKGWAVGTNGTVVTFDFE